jgi:F-type H+-transporting ATPase subunit epsilon
MSLNLKIISPERIVFIGEVDGVKVPGTNGEFEVLNNHAPIISSLGKGVVEYSHQGEKNQLEVNGGFIEVKDNDVSLCVETPLTTV